MPDSDDDRAAALARRQQRELDCEEILRQTAEVRARIGTRVPVPGPDLTARIEALEEGVSDVKATLAAAYDEAGLSEEPGRPALRVIEGGAA